MADNVTTPAIGAGDNNPVIAADDIAGVKHQRVKVEFGADGSATEVSSAAPLPVQETPNQGSLTDHSGTITSGGTSQQVMAANSSRKYLLIENVSSGDLWVNFGTAAVANQPSLRLASTGSLTMEAAFVSTQAVNIIGATTGQAFTAKEA